MPPSSQRFPLVFFNGERRRALIRALVYEEEEPDEGGAQEFSVELFVADTFRSVMGITVSLDEANAHWATPDTALHTGKTENRSSSTWIGTGSRN